MLARILPVVVVLVLAGCSARQDILKNRIGRNCTVNVRPSSLGASGEQPVPVNTMNINGAQVALSGKLVSSDDRWVTISTDSGEEIAIAQGDILSVTVQKPEK